MKSGKISVQVVICSEFQRCDEARVIGTLLHRLPKRQLLTNHTALIYLSSPDVFFSLEQLLPLLFENLVFQRDRAVERKLLLASGLNFLEYFSGSLVVLLFYHPALIEIFDKRFCLAFRAFKTAHLLENLL